MQSCLIQISQNLHEYKENGIGRKRPKLVCVDASLIWFWEYFRKALMELLIVSWKRNQNQISPEKRKKLKIHQGTGQERLI